MQAWRVQQLFDGTRFRGPATVLVDSDRIVGVEDAHHEPPTGCRVTDHEGTLLPGLVDCHVHLVATSTIGSLEQAGELSDEELDVRIRDSLAAEAVGGVTSVRDLGDRHYRTLEARELPGLSRVVAAGPPVTEPAGHCHYLGGEVSGVDGVRRAVAERVERGVDVVKVMASGGMLTPGSDSFGAQFAPPELRALVDAAHDAGLRVLAHAHSLTGVRHALAAGVDGIEHFTGLTADGLQLPDDLLAEVAAAGVQVCPTAGQDKSRQPPPEQMPPGMRAAFARMGIDFDSFATTRIEHLARMRAHGISIVSGTDAGIAPVKAHGGLRFAVFDLVDAGYPVDEALATATSVAADACGLGEVTGRIRPGLAADVLVVDGDLATDIRRLEGRVAVLVRGEPVPLP